MIHFAVLLSVLAAPQERADRFDALLKDSEDRTRRGVADELRRAFGPRSLLTDVPFERVSHKPFIPVWIDGRGPFTFILDTGSAGGWVIERRRALELGLPITDERRVHAGAGEGSRVLRGRTRNVAFRFGSVLRPGSAASTLTMAHVDGYEGRPVDGLLGYTFLARHVVEIDYAAERVRVHGQLDWRPGGPGARIPIDFLNGLVVVQATLTPKGGKPLQARLVVDTGSRASLILNRPFADGHEISASFGKKLEGTIGGGIGGESRGRLGRLDRLQIGRIRIDRPVTICSLDRSGVLASPAFDGIIGGPLLSKFRVTFDYARRLLVLDPNASFDDPDEYDGSGLFLTAAAPALDRFLVKSVLAGSPAAEAGIRRSDEVVSVDGRPSAGYTLETLRRLLRTRGRTVRLEFRRGDRRFTTALVLRRLF